jgi:hypothetical protein
VSGQRTILGCLSMTLLRRQRPFAGSEPTGKGSTHENHSCPCQRIVRATKKRTFAPSFYTREPITVAIGSGSPLRLVKGKTAIDGLSGSAKAGVSAAVADTAPVAIL